MVSEMLRVLDEDVLDLLAEAIETRILNRENDKEGEATSAEVNSRFVQFPYDDNIDMRDGIFGRRRRSTVYVEKGLAVSCVEAVTPEGVCWCLAMPDAATSASVAAETGPTPRVCPCLNAPGATKGKRTEGVCWCLAMPGAATPEAAARKCGCKENAGAKSSTQDKEPAEPIHDALWRTHDVSLLAKVPNAKLVKDFRPIAVLPVLYKLYSRSCTCWPRRPATDSTRLSSPSVSSTRHTRWCSSLDN